ncbi:MAG: helix-turn-helix domain-containing protein [Planctomycetota bacterium]
MVTTKYEARAISTRLREARNLAGFRTYAAAAKASGISAHTVKSSESGEHIPTGYHLAVLADCYSVSVDWLLGREVPVRPLPPKDVLVDQGAVEAILEAESEKEIEPYILVKPPMHLCLVEIPEKTGIVSPREALAISQALDAKIYGLASDLAHRWYRTHGSGG